MLGKTLNKKLLGVVGAAQSKHFPQACHAEDDAQHPAGDKADGRKIFDGNVLIHDKLPFDDAGFSSPWWSCMPRAVRMPEVFVDVKRRESCMPYYLLILTIVLLAGSANAQPAADEAEKRPFLQSIETALQSDIRTDAEKERDANRLPEQTLDFFGIDENMRVVELIPGAGWYTKILAPALRDTGKLYAGLGTGRLEASELLNEPGFEQVELLTIEAQIGRSENGRLATIGPFSLGVTDLDAALTFRNVHNFDAIGRANMNAAVFAALKPGGIYGVVDHTRRHMEADNPENGRRVDPVLAIKEIQAAGFEFIDYSDLHSRLDDELRYEVGRKSVTGNSDRFTFLFRKPKE